MPSINTLPTGTISMSQVNTELGKSSTLAISLDDADVRNLAGVPSGVISMNDLRGKSNEAWYLWNQIEDPNSFPSHAYTDLGGGVWSHRLYKDSGSSHNFVSSIWNVQCYGYSNNSTYVVNSLSAVTVAANTSKPQSQDCPTNYVSCRVGNPYNTRYSANFTLRSNKIKGVRGMFSVTERGYYNSAYARITITDGGVQKFYMFSLNYQGGTKEQYFEYSNPNAGEIKMLFECYGPKSGDGLPASVAVVDQLEVLY